MSRLGLFILFAIVWFASATAPSTAFPGRPRTSNACAWQLVAAPSSTSDGNELLGVWSTSSTDAWAVGDHSENRTGDSWPLTEHFDGKAWSVVTSPQPDFSSLASVREITPTDVWAVGSAQDASGVPQTLTLHWDGTAWTIVASPDVGTQVNELDALAANSSDDVWAFGLYFDTTANKYLTLTLHWNGASWSVVPSGDVIGANDALFGGGSLGPTFVWAVGVEQGGGSPSALAERWNGSAWKIVPTPRIGYSDFRAFAPVAHHDSWAIGSYLSDSRFAPLAEFWNGNGLSVVPTPTVAGENTVANGATAVNATDVWAVGNTFTPDRTFTMNWNGSTWSVAASPNRGVIGDDLDAATMIPGTLDVWAVGRYFSHPTKTKTLVMELRC